MLRWTSSGIGPVILCHNGISDSGIIDCGMIGFSMQINCSNVIPFGWESIEEQHTQRIAIVCDSSCFESFNIGVKTTHLHTGMLHSTNPEPDHGPEVPEKLRDPSRAKSISQGGPTVKCKKTELRGIPMIGQIGIRISDD